jgi:hypothetical protein
VLAFPAGDRVRQEVLDLAVAGAVLGGGNVLDLRGECSGEGN